MSGGPRRGSRGGRRFVIHKHDATTPHYDFRLEAGGVLFSWAVPKGPSTDTRVRRLAMPTEDHRIGYLEFEGVIPEGQYGAGTVLVWDLGTYRNLRAGKGRKSLGMSASRDDGLIEVWLEGRKLRGGYVLKRTGDGRRPRWLIVKMNDEHADARRNPVSTEPDSVTTGRELPVWHAACRHLRQEVLNDMTSIRRFAKPLAALTIMLAWILPPAADGQYFGRNKVLWEDFDFEVLETEHFR